MQTNSLTLPNILTGLCYAMIAISACVAVTILYIASRIATYEFQSLNTTSAPRFEQAGYDKRVRFLKEDLLSPDAPLASI